MSAARIKAQALREAADDLASFRAFPWCVSRLRRRAERYESEHEVGVFDLQDTTSDRPGQRFDHTPTEESS